MSILKHYEQSTAIWCAMNYEELQQAAKECISIAIASAIREPEIYSDAYSLAWKIYQENFELKLTQQHNAIFVALFLMIFESNKPNANDVLKSMRCNPTTQ